MLYLETKASLKNEIVKNTPQNTSTEINGVLDEDAYTYRARTSSQDSSPGLEPGFRARTRRRTRQFFAFPPFSPPASHMTIKRTLRVRG